MKPRNKVLLAVIALTAITYTVNNNLATNEEIIGEIKECRKARLDYKQTISGHYYCAPKET